MGTDPGLHIDSSHPNRDYGGHLSMGDDRGWWRERRAELAEAIAYAKHVYATTEGKIGIYGITFFLMSTLLSYAALQYLSPTIQFPDAIRQYPRKLKIPCRVGRTTYLYGVEMFEELEGKNKYHIVLMCHKSDGTWIW